MKTRLAQAVQCQSTYVSQVLKGERHFSLEQAELLNRHLGHSPDEARFFMLLISLGRAGSRELRERLEEDLELQLEKQRNLKKRTKADRDELDPRIQAHYYRSWHVTAIHICLTIPAMRRRETIADALGLPLTQVSEALDFLVSVGLAEKRGGEYVTGQTAVFVGRDSPLLAHHHANWRHQAIRSIDRDRRQDIHYSSVISIRKKDAERIRALVLRCIEEAAAIWKTAEDEEELHSLCMDFFQVSGQ